MIIACPACHTRYVVPDSAIGVEGRTVRCAKCRHSWFQDGPALPGQPSAAAEAVAAPPPAPPPPAPPPPAPPPPPPAEVRAAPEPAVAVGMPQEAAPEPGPEPDPAPEPPVETAPAYAEPPAPVETAGSNPVYYDDEAQAVEDRSSFDFEPPFRPRRNPAKVWMLAASLFAAVATAATAAVWWYGLPDWAPMAKPTFAEAQPYLVLDFPAKRQDRRTLPNGTEYFGASGTVTNVGQSQRTVPTILIVLRDKRNRVVYSWEVVPPKRRLMPGESVTINEAVTDVPKSATAAEIGWKPG